MTLGNVHTSTCDDLFAAYALASMPVSAEVPQSRAHSQGETNTHPYELDHGATYGKERNSTGEWMV